MEANNTIETRARSLAGHVGDEVPPAVGGAQHKMAQRSAQDAQNTDARALLHHRKQIAKKNIQVRPVTWLTLSRRVDISWPAGYMVIISRAVRMTTSRRLVKTR